MNKYTKKERILHSVLFEVLALILVASFMFGFTDSNPLKLSLYGAFMSLMAMIWNYYYNILFDKKYGENREDRTIGLRILHGLGFELFLLVTSLPLLMLLIKESLLNTFIINLGFSIFYLIYAIIYNWLYDKTRLIILKK